jgi:ubiquinone/menaquinone biosynthesis C-methylase UbiE
VATSHHHPHFIPALGLHGLTPLYDVFTKLIRERSLKQQLVEQARIGPGMRVLDVGCGTGTLLLQLWQTHPEAELVGLDIDPEVLALARKKLEAAQARVQLHCGPLEQAPFEPATFDRITSSLMMHHLEPAQKVELLRAALRLLRPGGEIHVLDIAPPHTLAMRLAFAPFNALMRQDRMRVHLDGRFPRSLEEAGFVEVAHISSRSTPFGALGYFRGRRPA